MKLPVMLIAFNRPNITSDVLDAICKYNPKILYIAVDGPRNEKDVLASNEIKEMVKGKKTNCVIKTLYRKKNLGCRLAVTSAIDWFFENEEMGIILEDDCLPNQSFFLFMDELLPRYQNDESVGLISGNNFFYNKVTLPYSFYASTYTHIWGWGTWRRAWYGYRSSGILEEDISAVVNGKFKDPHERNFWIQNIKNANSGIIDTWDLQWTFFNWEKKRISIMPSKNLVTNIGFGAEATHTTREDSNLNRIPTEELNFPLIAPANLIPSQMLDYYTRRLFFPISYFEKIKIFLFQKLKGYR